MGCWEFRWVVLKLKCLGPCGFYRRLNKCYFWPYFKASLSYWSCLSLKSSWEISLGSARQLELVQYVRPELVFGLWMQRFIKHQNSRSENKSTTKSNLNIGPNFTIIHTEFSLCWQMSVNSNVLIYRTKPFLLFIQIPSLHPFLSYGLLLFGTYI